MASSSEIREWITAIGGLLGGIGAIWAAVLARRRKEDVTAVKTPGGSRFGEPLPLTPEIRKQWDRAFGFLVVAFVIVIISIGRGSQPQLSDWQVGAYVLGGMALGCVYLWLGVLYGRRAVWMHEQRAIAEFKESIQKEPNQALLPTPTAVTPPASHESRQP